jgi:hypothetical protein
MCERLGPKLCEGMERLLRKWYHPSRYLIVYNLVVGGFVKSLQACVKPSSPIEFIRLVPNLSGLYPNVGVAFNS